MLTSGITGLRRIAIEKFVSIYNRKKKEYPQSSPPLPFSSPLLFPNRLASLPFLKGLFFAFPSSFTTFYGTSMS